MTQHTQGPWEIVWPENTDVCPRIKSSEFGTICRLNNIWPVEDGYEENKANARLIAAAPDLREALIELDNAMQDIGGYAGRQGTWEVVQAAIAKAKGE